MLDILIQVRHGRVHLHLVLPFVLRPFLLELVVCALGLHQLVYEVDLDFVDVQNVWLIAAGGVVGDVAVDDAVVGGGDLETGLDRRGGSSAQSYRDWLLDDFEVALSQELKADVW